MALSVAVIGAGMAGSTCASLVRAAGMTVTVFDKGRAAGGRIATRTVDGAVFDNGAQYATASGLPFQTFLQKAAERNEATIWRPHIDDDREAVPGRDWYVGLPGMRGLIRDYASDLAPRQQIEIKKLDRKSHGWFLDDQHGQSHGPFHWVVVAVPAPQAFALLRDISAESAAIRDVTMAPCWALMIAFANKVRANADVFRRKDGAIAWAARQASKVREPSGTAGAWVVHATSDWSRANLEREPDAVAAELFSALKDLHPAFQDADPTIMTAHRWRYALVEKPLGVPYFNVSGLGIVAAGDWCLGGRVEAAYESGRAAAGAILRGD